MLVSLDGIGENLRATTFLSFVRFAAACTDLLNFVIDGLNLLLIVIGATLPLVDIADLIWLKQTNELR